MMRTVIIVEKNLSAGQAANVAAILMGQAAISNPVMYEGDEVRDMGDMMHASVKYSTVILKASAGHLVKTLKSVQNRKEIYSCTFTMMGQKLNDDFQTYKHLIEKSELEESQPLGVVLFGDANTLREITKKYSLF